MMLMVDIQQNCILWNNDGENVLFSSSLDYILYENLRRKSTTLCILTSPLRRLLNAPLKIPTSLIKFHILHKDHKRNSNIVRCFFRYLQRLFFSFFEYEVEIWRWWWWQCWTATALSSVAIFFFFLWVWGINLEMVMVAVLNRNGAMDLRSVAVLLTKVSR